VNNIIPNRSNSKELLGQKVEVTIDRTNPYLGKYAIMDGLI
jgi:hypothetical protein